MAVTRPKSGVTEYTSTGGAGSLLLTGPAPGYRGFVSADDGLSYHYAIYQEGTTFETGVGTYTHASRQLARTTVLANINGTTTPLSLGGGTKEVSIIIPGERVAMLDANNSWLADQTFNSNRIYLDDGNSWIEISSGDIFKLFLNNVQVFDVNYNNGLTYFQIMSTNEGGSEGPALVLRRDTNTPAANDQFGSIYGQTRDSGNTLQNFTRIRNSVISPTAGSFSGAMDFAVASAGALQTVLALRPNVVTIAAGCDLYTAGKTATSPTVTGAEIWRDGSVSAVCNNTTPLFLIRNGSDGEMIQLLRGTTVVSSVTVSGGTVNWASFTGAHWSDWAAGEMGDEQFGTVVAAAPGLLETTTFEYLPLVRLATADDPAVYGVVSGRQDTAFGRDRGDERSLLLINGLGTSQIRCLGAIKRGDLLHVSTTPGVAEAQADDNVRSTTVAKATQDSPDDGGERLVPCVLMAG